jgi:hypothetical protein
MAYDDELDFAFFPHAPDFFHPAIIPVNEQDMVFQVIIMKLDFRLPAFWSVEHWLKDRVMVSFHLLLFFHLQ